MQLYGAMVATTAATVLTKTAFCFEITLQLHQRALRSSSWRNHPPVGLFSKRPKFYWEDKAENDIDFARSSKKSLQQAALSTKTAKRARQGQKAKASEEDDELDENALFRDPKWLERAKHWVVLVDDEEAIRLAVGDYLFEQGYQVTACADAEALMEVLPILAEAARKQGLPINLNNDNDFENDEFGEGNAFRDSDSLLQLESPPRVPDIIITDIRMPISSMDGLQILKLIRSTTTSTRLSKVPVILLTAKALTSDRIAGYKAGADAYLPKPFHPDELLAMVDNAIRRRREMTGPNGQLSDLRNDMEDVLMLLRQNARTVVRRSDLASESSNNDSQVDSTNKSSDMPLLPRVVFTPVEREVLDLLCQGKSNGEIATIRGVNITGVHRSVQALYAKTETKTRTELVRWAMKNGEVERPTVD